MRWRCIGAGMGLALLPALVPALASADEPGASTEPAPGVSVHIGSVRPGTSVAIESDGEDGTARVVSRCFEDCEEVLDPGSYRLRLIGADGETLGTKGVSIRRPITFHVLDTSPGAATTGLVLGISGAVIALTGLVALAGLAFDSMDGGSSNPPPAWVPVYGLTATTVGVLMTTLGWVMFAHNRRLFRGEVIKDRKGHFLDRDAALLPPRFGIAPAPRGVTAGLTLSF